MVGRDAQVALHQHLAVSIAVKLDGDLQALVVDAREDLLELLLPQVLLVAVEEPQVGPIKVADLDLRCDLVNPLLLLSVGLDFGLVLVI